MLPHFEKTFPFFSFLSCSTCDETKVWIILCVERRVFLLHPIYKLHNSFIKHFYASFSGPLFGWKVVFVSLLHSAIYLVRKAVLVLRELCSPNLKSFSINFYVSTFEILVRGSLKGRLQAMTRSLYVEFSTNFPLLTKKLWVWSRASFIVSQQLSTNFPGKLGEQSVNWVSQFVNKVRLIRAEWFRNDKLFTCIWWTAQKLSNVSFSNARFMW